MMAHVPLMALDKPKRVLVVGGGDGGVLREVLKHPSIEKAMLCEIDRTVIDTALKYYPEIPGATFDDERTVVVIADGRKFVAETDERFDAIIVDCSEPIGPSAVLHTREFFADCKRALKEGGILITQNGLPFLFPDHLRETTRAFASLFDFVAPYMCTQPCYFGGPVRAQLGERRGRPPGDRREEARQAPVEARHRDALLDAGRAQRGVRAAGVRAKPWSSAGDRARGAARRRQGPPRQGNKNGASKLASRYLRGLSTAARCVPSSAS